MFEEKNFQWSLVAALERKITGAISGATPKSTASNYSKCYCSKIMIRGIVMKISLPENENHGTGTDGSHQVESIIFQPGDLMRFDEMNVIMTSGISCCGCGINPKYPNLTYFP